MIMDNVFNIKYKDSFDCANNIGNHQSFTDSHKKNPSKQ